MAIEHMHGTVARHHTPTMDRIQELKKKAADRKKEVEYWSKKKGKKVDLNSKRDDKAKAENDVDNQQPNFESHAQGQPSEGNRSTAQLDGVPQVKTDGVTDKEQRIGSDHDARPAGQEPVIGDGNVATPQEAPGGPVQHSTPDGGVQVGNA